MGIDLLAVFVFGDKQDLSGLRVVVSYDECV